MHVDPISIKFAETGELGCWTYFCILKMAAPSADDLVTELALNDNSSNTEGPNDGLSDKVDKEKKKEKVVVYHEFQAVVCLQKFGKTQNSSACRSNVKLDQDNCVALKQFRKSLNGFLGLRDMLAQEHMNQTYQMKLARTEPKRTGPGAGVEAFSIVTQQQWDLEREKLFIGNGSILKGIYNLNSMFSLGRVQLSLGGGCGRF